jgi:hypothetical protein
MLSDGSITPSTVTTAEPHFSESIRNVTVPLGREAVLSCVINNLADYKVSSSDGNLKDAKNIFLSENKTG